MTVEQFLNDSAQKLGKAGIETPRLDCLVLLEDTLHQNRAHLLAHPETAISHSDLTLLNNFITHRTQHVPLAYIRGRVDFYGRTFVVNKYVLVPRPETEAMIELLKKTDLPSRPRIADIGTGSGCIGITAALELPDAEVFLCDIDASALQVAKENVQAQNFGESFLPKIQQRDLLEGTEQIDVLLANLPYVPDSYSINKAATFEPKLALFAGEDGLDLYRRLWQQISALDHKPLHILTEALPQQHRALGALAKTAGYDPLERYGLIQHFKTGNSPIC